jgi:ribosomal protein S18 acetylase RimI-like enzyme
MEIRRATVKDISTVVPIQADVQRMHLSAYPQHYFNTSPDDLAGYFKYHLERDSSVVFVAESSGKILGYVVATIRKQPDNPFARGGMIGYLDQVAVAADSRGGGTGQKLLEALKVELKNRDVQRLYLDVGSFNSKAHEFFESQGFKDFSRKMVYKLADNN